MTENYTPKPTPPLDWETPEPPEPADRAQGTTDVVKDQAADLGHGGLEAGKHAADAAREQAANVTAEARRQGKDLIREAQGQLTEQAGQQQQRLAAELRGISDELSAMASRSDHSGMAADLAQQAAGTTRNIAQWLDDREPGQLLQEVKTFARQRPGVFLALAAGTGLLAGRLTRGLAAEAHDQGAPAPATRVPQSLPESSADQMTGAGDADYASPASPGYPASTSLGGTAAGEIPASATGLPPSWPADYADEEAAAPAGYERPPGHGPRTEGTL
jgi:hypothetical protein